MDFDRAYANFDFIEGSAGLPDEWANRSANLLNKLSDKAILGLPYGAGERQRFDLFLPPETPKGLMVFIHGGYWSETHRDLWSYLAEGGIGRGWAVALPSYTLAPEARISDITQEIRRALPVIAARVPQGDLVVTGHSAGGHLAARMACADLGLAREVRARLRRVLPISPLSELEPIAKTAMNDLLRLDAAEIAAESPARLPRLSGPETAIWVGGDERPAFLWQARLLSEEWGCPWHVAKGAHHFSVLEPLCDPKSGMMRYLTGDCAFDAAL